MTDCQGEQHNCSSVTTSQRCQHQRHQHSTIEKRRTTSKVPLLEDSVVMRADWSSICTTIIFHKVFRSVNSLCNFYFMDHNKSSRLNDKENDHLKFKIHSFKVKQTGS